MAESGQPGDLRDRFLQIAYDLTLNRSSPLIEIQDVAADLGLPRDRATLRDSGSEVKRLASYWGQKGCIRNVGDGFGTFALTPEGMTEAEGRNRPPEPSVSNTWHVGQANHSNLNSGVQGDIDMRITYDFRGIEGLIDRHADPAQAPEFREALEEVRGQIERDGAIKGGSLARFNDLMNDAGWFTGPLAGLVMQFLAGGAV